ncbi:TonB-dependent receptor domain-containing protein [Candidatus Neomarinimicrobiota bacterium]
MKRAIVLLALVVLPVMILAQTAGKLTGVVTSTDGTPLAGANVVLEGTSMGAATDEDGRYYILNVPIAHYSVRADYIGYRSSTINNIRVSVGLTTTTDFSLQVAAVEGEEVIVTAEKPLVVLDATTTTKIIDTEAIQALPIRNVGAMVALQAGVVGNNVRGGRGSDNAYYVDGVLMKQTWLGGNLMGGISQRALSEVSLQSGGMSAEYGNATGGVMVIAAKPGGSKFSGSAEYVTDLGTSTPGKDRDALYSYGNQLLNLDLGGPIGDNIQFYMNIENEKNADNTPAPITSPFGDVYEYQSLSSADSAFLFVDGDITSGYNDDIFYFQEFIRNNQSDTDELLWLNRMLGNDDFMDTLDDLVEIGEWHNAAGIIAPASWVDTTYVAGANYEQLYGPKRGFDNNRLRFSGNLVFDFKPFRIKIGAIGYNFDTRRYVLPGFANSTALFHLLNTDNVFTRETEQRIGYINATYNISPRSFLKATGSYKSFYLTEFDDDFGYDIEAYGKRTTEFGSPNYYYSGHGIEPLPPQELAYQNALGERVDSFEERLEKTLGLRTDYVNQIGKHELTAGLEYYNTEITRYRNVQAGEWWQQVATLDTNFNGQVDPFELTTGDVDEWRYSVYRNMYIDNHGYDIYGDEASSYDFETGAQGPANPVNFRAYISDKLEYKDLVISLGLAYESFNSNAYAPDSDGDGVGDNEGFNIINLTRNRIDRSGDKEGSYPWEKVEGFTAFLPRIGFAFPVTDKTVFRAQYGNYMQNVPLLFLYMSDSELAANVTQGNYTNTANPTLKPERTTSYEVGFTQQIGSSAALDVSGFYKEVRDYLLSQNRYNSTVDGSQFVWAQYQNGDFGITTGFQFNLRMRRVNGFLADLNYTIMWARGTGSNADSNYYINWMGDDIQDYPSTINALDYDQRHTASVLLDWRSQQRDGILADFGFNATYSFGSGQAYTPSRILSYYFAKQNDFPVAAVNSGSMPATSSLDLKIDKAFTVGGVRLNVYLLALNALNHINATNVFGTGLPDSDGWLSTAPGQTWVEGQNETFDNANPVSYYNDVINTADRYGIPRTVRLGVQINL